MFRIVDDRLREFGAILQATHGDWRPLVAPDTGDQAPPPSGPPAPNAPARS